MHQRILNKLIRIADAHGWVHRGTLKGWDKGCSISFNSSQDDSAPNTCTFWFHLESNEDAIIGFGWSREKPDEIRTINGSFSITTPINLSYVSSHKKLVQFFGDSKRKFTKPKGVSRRDLFTKIGEFFSK